MTIHSEPEKYGLTPIGEVEFSSGCYEFDTSVVWHDDDRRVYAAHDSGCSCPLPFESIGRNDLTPITKLQDLVDYFDKRKADSYRYDPDDEWNADERARIDGQIGSVIEKARAFL